MEDDVFKQISESVKKAIQSLRKIRMPQYERKQKETKKDSKHGGSNNHNKKSNKVRRKMAKESRRINRKRSK